MSSMLILIMTMMTIMEMAIMVMTMLMMTRSKDPNCQKHCKNSLYKF